MKIIKQQKHILQKNNNKQTLLLVIFELMNVKSTSSTQHFNVEWGRGIDAKPANSQNYYD